MKYWKRNDVRRRKNLLENGFMFPEGIIVLRVCNRLINLLKVFYHHIAIDSNFRLQSLNHKKRLKLRKDCLQNCTANKTIFHFITEIKSRQLHLVLKNVSVLGGFSLNLNPTERLKTCTYKYHMRRIHFLNSMKIL